MFHSQIQDHSLAQELKVDRAREKAKERRGRGAGDRDSWEAELWGGSLEGVPEPARQAVEYLHDRCGSYKNSRLYFRSCPWAHGVTML